MKKTVFALAFLFGALSINAQLVVNQNGKVGINYPSTLSSLSSSLNIGGDNRNFVVNIQPALGNGLNIKTGDGGLNRYGLKISTKLANDTTASSIYILQTQGSSNRATHGIKSCSGLSTGGLMVWLADSMVFLRELRLMAQEFWEALLPLWLYLMSSTDMQAIFVAMFA